MFGYRSRTSKSSVVKKSSLPVPIGDRPLRSGQDSNLHIVCAMIDFKRLEDKIKIGREICPGMSIWLIILNFRPEAFKLKDERETKIAFCHCSTRLSYQTFRSELELNQRQTGNDFMRLVILSKSNRSWRENQRLVLYQLSYRLDFPNREGLEPPTTRLTVDN